MKQKKSILRGCHAGAFLVAVGIVTFLCLGCHTANMPIESHDETTRGDQITEEASVESDTLVSTDEVGEETNDAVSDEMVGSDDPEPSSSESSSTDAGQDSPSESTTGRPEEPIESVTEATTAEPEFLSYDAYHAMSAAEQEAHFNSFDSPAAFFEWYNAAKAKYLEEHPNAEIGPDGSIILP